MAGFSVVHILCHEIDNTYCWVFVLFAGVFTGVAMRMYDESLFSRIKTLNATGAAKAVEQSLKDSHADALLEAFTRSWNAGMESQWATLARLLETMDAAQTEEAPHLIDNMQRIIALCWQRAEEEYQALEHFQDQNTMDVWHAIGHLQSTTIRPWIKKWIISAGLTAEVSLERFTAELNLEGFTTVYGRWWGLVQAIRTVQEFSWAKPPEPSPATIEAVLLFMLKSKKVPEAEVDVFGKCKFCWRFVPLAESSGHNHLYCQFHQRNTKEYKRALKLEQETERLMSCMESYINSLHKRSLQHWVAYHQNLPPNWERLFRDDVVSLAASISWPMEYSMEILHHYFPKVFAFVGISGTDWCPQQIVNALDPIPDDIRNDIRIRWKALHHVFASNLTLFRRELCHAEAFFIIYDRLFDKVKRGGARPRSKVM